MKFFSCCKKKLKPMDMPLQASPHILVERNNSKVDLPCSPRLPEPSSEIITKNPAFRAKK